MSLWWIEPRIDINEGIVACERRFHSQRILLPKSQRAVTFRRRKSCSLHPTGLASICPATAEITAWQMLRPTHEYGHTPFRDCCESLHRRIVKAEIRSTLAAGALTVLIRSGSDSSKVEQRLDKEIDRLLILRWQLLELRYPS